MKRIVVAFALATNAWLASGQAPALLTPGLPIVGIAAAPGSTTSAIAVAGTGGNAYPASESPDLAIDGNTATKYLNFAKTNTGLIVTIPGGLATVTAIRFTTANDVPERDPLAVTLEGANASDPAAAAAAGSAWTLLYSGASGLATDPGRFTSGPTVTFANTARFTTYRLLVTNVRNASGANSMQFSEVQFFGAAPDTEPPTIAAKAPAPGTQNSLDSIVVSFSEPVQGVNAADLLVNGHPATGVGGGPATYTFSFPPPPLGPVQITWSTSHGITDLSSTPNAFNATGPGATWQYNFVDDIAPTATVLPFPGAVVRQLHELEVLFSEAVTNVEASDLLINSAPASTVDKVAPGQFVFSFPEPAAGTVRVAWATGHGIRDLATNNFAGGAWTYTLDPSLPSTGVIISEFMASNDETLNDEDGDPSDWIELRNTDSTTASLNGWYLTDDIDNLKKWRIPNASLAPETYLVVFASDKNRTNPAAQLHTNFKLAKDRDYLALVSPEGQVVSAFTPYYPTQQTDVSYGRDQTTPTFVGYFIQPTPGGPNSTGGAGFAPPVVMSRPGGTFRSTFQLTLATASPTATIRYTLDGSAPTASSPLYTAPITISTTSRIRARAFESSLLPGPIQSESYILLASSLVNFSSDLPLMVIHNFGAGAVPADTDQPGFLAIFEPGATGRSSLTNMPALTTRIGFNIRGRSTAGYAVELWNEANQDKNMSVLGMPEESDWVLYAPNMYDRPLIHNSFIYHLSNEIGRYAPRTRFVELWVNTTGGALTGPVPSGDYRGVYVLMEKIKRNERRVDINRLEPQNTQAPSVTGGYMFKVGDDMDFNERAFYAANLNIAYQYPNGLEMVTSQRVAQSNYIQSYFNSFYAALTGPDPDNAATGYPAYIDLDSWIDHHLLNVATLNVDGLRLSAYFFKDRDKRIEMGPIWDFDRSMGTSGGDDARPFNPRNWRGLSNDGGTDFFNAAVWSNPWYSLLFKRPDFWQRYIDRYQELRTTYFSNAHLHALIDGLAAQLREAQPRDVLQWHDTTPRSGTLSYNGYTHTFHGTYQGEIDFMKRWLNDRLDFMDTNFLARPIASRPAGPVSAGSTVTLSDPAGATIYYTLNGTDPALPALPQVLINEALTHTDLPQLDSIELYNPGPGNADISGWYLTDSFESPRKFQLPTPTILAPGAYVVFDESDFNPANANGFRINSLGDDLHIFSADQDGNLSGYVASVEFGAAQNGVSFGRHTDSAGGIHFVAQANLTLGTDNSSPRVGPLVINEIMYNPTPVDGTNNNTRDEFVEVRNITGTSTPLYDPATPTNTWHLRGGIQFDFPTNVTLASGAALVVVGFDPVWQPGDLQAFRTRYGIDTNVLILGPYAGKLANEGDSVRLLKPDPPRTIPGPDLGLVPYVLVDEVRYQAAAPWPTDANATGKSINRTAPAVFGDDPAHWQSATPTPGSSSAPLNPDVDGDGLPDDWEREHGLDPNSSTGDNGADGDPDHDSLRNIQEYTAGTNPQDPLSYLRVSSVTETGSVLRLRFQAVAGKTYSVLYRTAIAAGPWAKLVDIPAQAQTTEIEVTDTNPGAAGERFYRLVTPSL